MTIWTSRFLLLLSLTLVPTLAHAAEKVELFFPLDRPLSEAVARMGGILSGLGAKVRDTKDRRDRIVSGTKTTETQWLWEVSFMSAQTVGKPAHDMRLFCATSQEPAHDFCLRLQQLYLLEE